MQFEIVDDVSRCENAFLLGSGGLIKEGSFRFLYRWSLNFCVVFIWDGLKGTKMGGRRVNIDFER